MSDIRPRVLRAPQEEMSLAELQTLFQPKSPVETPQATIHEAVAVTSMTVPEVLSEPLVAVPQHTEGRESVVEVEDWFGTDEFVSIERNPTRAVSDTEAERPREKPVSEVETPEAPVPLRPVMMSTRHSLAGKRAPRQRALRRRVSFSKRWENMVTCLKESGAHYGESLMWQGRVWQHGFSWKRGFGFAGVAACLWLGVLGYKAIALKGQVLGVSATAVDTLQTAVSDVKQKDLVRSQRNFETAAEGFGEASRQLNDWNSTLVEFSRFVPGASQLASGKYALEAGQHFALAGAALNTVLKTSLDASKQGINGLPLLSLLNTTKASTTTALSELKQAEDALNKVNIDDLPQDKRAKFLLIKENLPTVINSMQVFLDQSTLLADVFGSNGPRKYLFLLQNNQEARATGGFIGTYALLDINNGRVRKFFVDGVFDPDGQLSQSIVPPSPLQKVSGAWSLHDSNWFPDFPLSAEKAISFYEKTGGPTVDGVITLTPTVIQKLLTLTGPITLDDYGVTLDADNFMALVQDQVEFRYDKTENKPKKILADLVPLLLDRLTAVKDVDQVKQTLSTLEESLNEKHILLYARNHDIQGFIHEAGWSGEVLAAKRDYLSVINTNINGYKTDGVVEQSIQHQADIQGDGSIIDTVTITRKHTGGHTPYDFWNRVNADYMRVYVPAGATLLRAEGQTRETVEAPLDYQALHFATDPDVVAEEKGMTVDPKTGTRIYQQSGKTVFANWVYVSPGETATITYAYRLPFRVESSDPETASVLHGTYSVVFQKQSGSIGSKLASTVTYPKDWVSLWQTPAELLASEARFRFEQDLQTDRFYGIVFGYPKQ